MSDEVDVRFRAAVGFVNAVAAEAERLGGRPDPDVVEEVVLETVDGETWVATPPGAPACERHGFLVVGGRGRARLPDAMRPGSGVSRVVLGLPTRLRGADLEEYLLRSIESDERRRRSSARARDLLRSWLRPDQRETFERLLRFDVVARSGTRYRIELGSHQNVVVLDESGEPSYRLCAPCVGEVPAEDTMLAQKLMLETDEDGFLATANRFDTAWSADSLCAFLDGIRVEPPKGADGKTKVWMTWQHGALVPCVVVGGRVAMLVPGPPGPLAPAFSRQSAGRGASSGP